MNIQYPGTPTGKRSVRTNIWGNVVGYVSGRRFWEFGSAGGWTDKVAAEWLKGKTLEQAQMGDVE